MGKVYEIVSREVECGLFKKRLLPGFVLKNGIVLMESEKDENGDYICGAGMDGIYLMTPSAYRPVYDADGVEVAAFEQVR